MLSEVVRYCWKWVLRGGTRAQESRGSGPGWGKEWGGPGGRWKELPTEHHFTREDMGRMGTGMDRAWCIWQHLVCRYGNEEAKACRPADGEAADGRKEGFPKGAGTAKGSVVMQGMWKKCLWTSSDLINSRHVDWFCILHHYFHAKTVHLNSVKHEVRCCVSWYVMDSNLF